jgi:hypothetical protein
LAGEPRIHAYFHNLLPASSPHSHSISSSFAALLCHGSR